jgi:hypothetical protein
MGDYVGAILDLTRRGPSFQVGFGANDKNANYGASAWLNWTRTRRPNNSNITIASSGTGDINIDLGFDCVTRSSTPGGGPYTPPTTLVDQDFFIPGVGVYTFESGSEFVEFPDGTGKVSGLLRDRVTPTKCFNFVMSFGGRITPGQAGHPPAGSPKLFLDPSAYVANGGPVDPSTWRYYATTEVVLIGCGGNTGAVLEGTRYGAAMQVGIGANGFNTNFGMSVWLDLSVVRQPDAGGPIQVPEFGDIQTNLGAPCLALREDFGTRCGPDLTASVLRDPNGSYLLDFQVTNSPVTPTGFIVIGVSETSMPLPGSPCVLRTQPAILHPIAISASGAGRRTVPVPPRLVVDVRTQYLGVVLNHPSGNLFHTSDGAHVAVYGATSTIGGIPDNFAAPFEPTSLTGSFGSYIGNGVDFDEAVAGSKFGHTINVPDRRNLTGLRLHVRLSGAVDQPETDTISLQFQGGSSFAWSARISSLPGLSSYARGSRVWVTLDLANLPGGVNLVSQVLQRGSLDVCVDDDSAIDCIELAGY